MCGGLGTRLRLCGGLGMRLRLCSGLGMRLRLCGGLGTRLRLCGGLGTGLKDVWWPGNKTKNGQCGWGMSFVKPYNMKTEYFTTSIYGQSAYTGNNVSNSCVSLLSYSCVSTQVTERPRKVRGREDMC